MMSWVVVRFLKENNIEAVPKQWITSCQNYCYWPPKSENVEKAIRNCKPLEEHWTKFEIIVVSKKSYESFKKASAKAEKACEKSDLSETEIEYEGRSHRRPQLFANDDFVYGYSSESEDNRFTKKLPVTPKAPLPMTPTNTGCTKSLPAVQYSLTAKSLTGTSSQFPGNSSFDRHFEQLLRKLTVIREHQKQQDEKLEEITRDLKIVTEHLLENRNLPTSILEEDNIMEKLPLKTPEELHSFNELLGNDNQLKQLVKSMFRLGGIHYKEGVRRVMSKLLSDDLALQYSFKGHKGKYDFSKLKISDCVIEAVGLIDKATSAKDIEGAVAIWLSKAKERIQRKK